ncbi:MAG: hypothetical protein WC815_19525 [Vicinamibacterales bacterium]|jgi:hypothetical protein
MTSPSTSLRLAGGVILAAVVVAAITTPAGTTAPNLAGQANLSELWQDPGDIAARDLRWGRGGQALAPSADVEYAFKAIDAVGYSAGYDVVDPEGRPWDVKTGDEGQPEVIASRLLWAVGYHQPVVYYLPEWRLTNGPVPRPLPGRFRLESDHAALGDWSWNENPFKGTRELRGLVLANLLINNWDLKSSNNKFLMVPMPAGTERWFVVQDLGASFGKTAWPIGTRNRLEDFESQRFVLGVQDGRVQFDYHARHRELLEDLAPADVLWILGLFNRITDQQWNDVFSAAAMSADTSSRYIRKMKAKIQEGLALSGQGTS